MTCTAHTTHDNLIKNSCCLLCIHCTAGGGRAIQDDKKHMEGMQMNKMYIILWRNNSGQQGRSAVFAGSEKEAKQKLKKHHPDRLQRHMFTERVVHDVKEVIT